MGHGLADLFRRGYSYRPWISVGFLLLSFVLGVAWFVILVAFIAAGGGLAITLIGLPILALTMILWRQMANLERARIRGFFGERIENPYRPARNGSWSTRLRGMLSDPATWKALLHSFLLFPIGIAELVIVAAFLGTPLSLMATPITYSIADYNSWMDFIYEINTLPAALLVCLVGLLLLPFFLIALEGLARLHVAFARIVLGPNEIEQLTERVGALTKSRSDVLDATIVERQRIERDLHDGAQQRLVSLAMDLGMAREKMKSDPDSARDLVESSHEEAKRVLVELRELVRGIHPAVLTDRGLDAAISAVAGRSKVPVSVNVDLSERPPEAVESAAYFVVVESLTNITKHSQATEAHVEVQRKGDVLTVEVTDNGVGGASPYLGSGLAGLDARLDALDGQLSVESPEGGPTRVRAEIPCAS